MTMSNQQASMKNPIWHQPIGRTCSCHRNHKANAVGQPQKSEMLWAKGRTNALRRWWVIPPLPPNLCGGCWEWCVFQVVTWGQKLMKNSLILSMPSFARRPGPGHWHCSQHPWLSRYRWSRSRCLEHRWSGKLQFVTGCCWGENLWEGCEKISTKPGSLVF